VVGGGQTRRVNYLAPRMSGLPAGFSGTLASALGTAAVAFGAAAAISWNWPVSRGTTAASQDVIRKPLPLCRQAHLALVSINEVANPALSQANETPS
jgi:hypothetical protein